MVTAMRTHAQRVEQERQRVLEHFARGSIGAQERDRRLARADATAARDLTRREKDEILDAAGGWCEYCRKKMARVVDHVMPVHLGGTSDRDNLKAACKLCNVDKHDLTVDEWQQTRIDEGHSWPPDWDAELAASLGLPSLAPPPEMRAGVLAAMDRERAAREERNAREDAERKAQWAALAAEHDKAYRERLAAELARYADRQNSVGRAGLEPATEPL